MITVVVRFFAIVMRISRTDDMIFIKESVDMDRLRGKRKSEYSDQQPYIPTSIFYQYSHYAGFRKRGKDTTFF